MEWPQNVLADNSSRFASHCELSDRLASKDAFVVLRLFQRTISRPVEVDPGLANAFRG